MQRSKFIDDAAADALLMSFRLRRCHGIVAVPAAYRPWRVRLEAAWLA